MYYSGKERGKEGEPNTNSILLVIDDQPLLFQNSLEGIMNEVDGLESFFLSPKDLGILTDDQIQRISLVIADQFYGTYQPYLVAKDFLEKLGKVNKNADLIETSYAPSFEQVYEQSLGILNSTSLLDEIREDMISWPKKAAGFLMKLKWKSNFAFHQAQVVDMVLKADGIAGNMRRSEILEESFVKTFDHKYFPMFLKIAGITEQQYIQSFRLQYKDDKKTGELIHCAWQIMGILSVMGDDPNLYSENVKRIKEVILPEDNTWFIQRPHR